MKKNSVQKLKPIEFGFASAISTSTLALFATTLNLMSPNIKTITPFLTAIYKPFGYDISITGALIGSLYIAIDTFILTWTFAWIYNKLL